MTLKTRYNLWKMRKSLSADKQFKADLFKKLNVILDTNYNVKYSWNQTIWFKHAVGFASVILAAGSLGTGAFAYTNPEVTEGSILYPVKEKLEKIEEIAQVTPEAKAKFYLKKIQRREEEKIILQKKINVIPSPKRVDLVSTSTVEIDLDEPVSLNQKKIEKIEQSIEQAEDKLEREDKIIEKNESKDIKTIKLRAQVKERLKARLEKRKVQQDNDSKDADLKEVKGIKLREQVRERAKIKENLEKQNDRLKNREELLKIEFENKFPDAD